MVGALLGAHLYRLSLVGTDVADLFVKPWTAGTGCGVSLLLNAASPLRAELMVSHVTASRVLASV